MSVWRWRRRRNQDHGYWENPEGERVGPIPLDENGRAAFVPADQLAAAVKAEREWCERIRDVDQRDAGDGRLLAALANHASIRLRELEGQ